MLELSCDRTFDNITYIYKDKILIYTLIINNHKNTQKNIR